MSKNNSVVRYNDELYTLLNKISVSLSSCFNKKSIASCYWCSNIYAEKLLEYCYGDKPLSLPINFHKIENKLKIFTGQVDMKDFSNDNIKRPNRKVSQLLIEKNPITQENEVIIYVDKNIPTLQKRYAVTNEIAKYILHINDKKIYEDYFVMPMLPVNSYDLIADIFSIFLLIPMKLFLDEFYEYVKYRSDTQKIPISTEEWIKYLAERAGVPEYYVAYEYQYLRSCAFWIYQALTADSEKLKEIRMTKTELKEIRNWISEEKFNKIRYLLYQIE